MRTLLDDHRCLPTSTARVNPRVCFCTFWLSRQTVPPGERSGNLRPRAELREAVCRSSQGCYLLLTHSLEITFYQHTRGDAPPPSPLFSNTISYRQHKCRKLFVYRLFRKINLGACFPNSAAFYVLSALLSGGGMHSQEASCIVSVGRKATKERTKHA